MENLKLFIYTKWSLIAINKSGYIINQFILFKGQSVWILTTDIWQIKLDYSSRFDRKTQSWNEANVEPLVVYWCINTRIDETVSIALGKMK